MAKSPCYFAVDDRLKARFEGSNIDRSFFYKELKLVKPTFLFEFKIKQRLRTLFFDVVDRALNIQFASLKPPILYFVKPSVFFA